MKKTVLSLVLAAALVTPAVAKDSDNSCVLLGRLAHAIMQHRQQGTTLVEMYEILPNPTEFSSQMILEAYDRPLFSTMEAKKRATSEFANSWVLSCEKARLK